MKRAILITVTTFAFFSFIFSACCFDSVDATIHYIVCSVDLCWLSLFVYANRSYLRRKFG